MSTKFPLPNDLDLARTVENVLWWTGYWRRNEISVRVDGGCVTLSGEVEWDYQKRTAVHALKHVVGIEAIVDNISIRFDAAAAAPLPRPDEPGKMDDALTFSRWS